MAVRGENGKNIANRTVLITGANRGIGRALVERRLDGERRGYMRTRSELQAAEVTPLTLDVTNAQGTRVTF
jgi:NAD(P)-dependent dehydrogenase (short-subunit alcohol dehydrogenase family)